MAGKPKAKKTPVKYLAATSALVPPEQLSLAGLVDSDALAWFRYLRGDPANQAIVLLIQVLRNQNGNQPGTDPEVIKRLDQISAQLAKLTPGPAVRGTFILEENAMPFTLGDDQKVSGGVSWQDAKGQAAKVDGAVAYASSDEAVATIGDNGDGTFTIVAGIVGLAQITATADADLGAGVVQVIATLDLEVVAGQAVAGTIAPGTPEPQ